MELLRVLHFGWMYTCVFIGIGKMQNDTKDWRKMKRMIWLMRTIVLQGGWPLFYIEWRWCWWTRIILISKTSWLLVCSFWHCLRSFWRFVSNFLHRKTTPKLWLSVGWNFYFAIHWVQPLVGGCSFEYNIPFLTRLFKKKVKVGGLHGSIKSVR